MEFRCKNCNSRNYFTRTIILPGKDSKKFNPKLNTYNMKICSDCGYSELYACEIVSKEEKKIKKEAKSFSKLATGQNMCVNEKKES